MFRYFFTYIDNIPRRNYNSMFSVQHLLAIGMVICMWCILTILFKDKSDEKKWRMLILISLLLPFTEGAQMLWYNAVGQFSWGYTLPLHLCSLMCIVLPVMTITRSKLLMEYSYAMGLAPAFMTLLTPDVYYYPSISFIYIQSMLVHGIICFIPIFMVFGMGFRPDIRSLPKTVAMLIAFALLVTPINIVTNGNYFFLRFPAPGSPMEFFAKQVGSPWYLIPTFLLGCFLWVILYMPFVLLKRHKRYSQNPADREKIRILF